MYILQYQIPLIGQAIKINHTTEDEVVITFEVWWEGLGIYNITRTDTIKYPCLYTEYECRKAHTVHTTHPGVISSKAGTFSKSCYCINHKLQAVRHINIHIILHLAN